MAAPVAMGGHVDPNSQMELVGHSIVRSLSLPNVHVPADLHAHTIVNCHHHTLFKSLTCFPTVHNFWVLNIFQVLTSYPYSDQQYGGMITYAPQPMVC